MATSYTRNQWSTALVASMVHGTITGGEVGLTPVAFVIGWTCAEYSAAESKTASYNCLNMTNGQDIAAFNPTVISKNGIVAFKTFADGVNATAARLKNSPLYQHIALGLTDNDNSAFNIAVLLSAPAVTFPYNPSAGVKEDLGHWVNGPNGGAISQSYLDNIGHGLNSGGDNLTGVDGDTTISTQSSGIYTSTPSSSTPQVSARQIIKVSAGALLVVAGLALFLKSFAPGAMGAVVKAAL